MKIHKETRAATAQIVHEGIVEEAKESGYYAVLIYKTSYFYQYEQVSGDQFCTEWCQKGYFDFTNSVFSDCTKAL